MRTMPLLAFLAAVFALTAAPGCGSDSSSSGSGSDLEGIPPIHFTADGGRATAGTDTDGGDGGTITLFAQGDVLFDDERPRPTATDNALQDLLDDDSTITYTALAAELSPTINGTTAEFDLTGDFYLPSDATLDLGDATGGTIDSVYFEMSGHIIIEGTIVLTRADADAVNLEITSDSDSDMPILFTGHLDGRGSETHNGATVEIEAFDDNAGAFILGTANVSGGDGDATSNAGSAGSFHVEVDGDLILREFGVLARGGDGTGDGGDGGRFSIYNYWQRADILAPIHWGGDMSGGHGGSGDGGSGGSINHWFGDGDTTISMRVIARGGNSVQGNGGQGGNNSWVWVYDGTETGTLTGTLHITAPGGNSEEGNGGVGGYGAIGAENLIDVSFEGNVDGGNSVTGQGGNGGSGVEVYAYNTTNVELIGYSSGGNGGTNGGNGGGVNVRTNESPPGVMTYENTSVTATIHGGNGDTGSGGMAGWVDFGNNSTGSLEFNAINCRIHATGNGGHGGNGGNDGAWVNVYHQSGSIEMEIHLTGHGGDSADDSDAGDGGGILTQMYGGHLDIHATGSLNGGNGAGSADAGRGGFLFVWPDGNSNIGSAEIYVADLSMRGGNAENGDGGNGGTLDIRCGAGSETDSFFTATYVNIDARGGDSQGGDGGNGGEIEVAILRRVAEFNGGSFNLDGGHGGTGSGMSGEGGHGGVIELQMHDHDLIWGVAVSANGGTSSGDDMDAGNGGEFIVHLNDNNTGTSGSAVVSGTFNLRGGTAMGSGDGGSIGVFQIAQNNAGTGGNITSSAIVDATGGSSESGGNGGGQRVDPTLLLFGHGDTIVSGSLNFSGGGGGGTDEGAHGAEITISSEGNAVEINAVITVNGGEGLTSSGNGGVVTIGEGDADSIEIQADAEIRANGGATGTPGNAGTIDINAATSGGQDVDVHVDAILETYDGDGTDQSGTNIIID
jgi:hypothetical protein